MYKIQSVTPANWVVSLIKYLVIVLVICIVVIFFTHYRPSVDSFSEQRWNTALNLNSQAELFYELENATANITDNTTQLKNNTSIVLIKVNTQDAAPKKNEPDDVNNIKDQRTMENNDNNQLTQLTRNNIKKIEGGRCDSAVADKKGHLHAEYSRKGYPFQLQHNFPSLNGSIMNLSNITEGSYNCDYSTCEWKNLCIDHGHNNTMFMVNDIKFPIFHFRSKGVNYSVRVAYRNITGQRESIKFINGTTHMFTLDFSNWFFTMLKAFSLHKTVNLYTGTDRDFNLMIYMRGHFVRRLEDPYFQLYRIVHPKVPFIYDLQTSLQDRSTTITCFERILLGYEYRGQTLTGFTHKHLTEGMAMVKEKAKTELTAEKRDFNRRLMDIHGTLGRELRAFKRYALRQFNLMDVAMEPKTAVLVTRHEGRFCDQKPYRVILNQPDLIKIMEEEGYTVKVVDFSGMSAPEQIETSRSANLLIGVHGAGMANMFWMRPTACIIELHTYGFQKYGYETFAHYLKIPYVSWVNKKEENTRVTWHSVKYLPTHANYYRSRDQIIDPEEFRRAVQAAQLIGVKPMKRR